MAAILLALAAVVQVKDLLGAYASMSQTGDWALLVGSARSAWHGLTPFWPPGVTGIQRLVQIRTPYPPTYYFLMWPWVQLPDNIARLLWLGLQEGSLGVLIAGVYAGIGRPGLVEGMTATALVVMLFPVRQAIFEGQLGVILAAMLVLTLLADRRGWQAAGGLALGLAVAIKITPVFVLPYFIWRRRWRLVAVSLVVPLGLVLLTLAFGWAPRWAEFPVIFLPLGRGTGFLANQGLNGIMLRLFHPALDSDPLLADLPPLFHAAWLIVEAAFAAALAVLVVRMLRARERGSLPSAEREWAAYAVVLLGVPLLQPYAWFHHLAAAGVAVIVVVRLATRGRLAPIPLTLMGIAYLGATVLFLPAYTAARGIPGAQLAGDPALQLGTSIVGFSALLALGSAWALVKSTAGRRDAVDRIG